MEETVLPNQPVEVPAKPARPWLKILSLVIFGLIFISFLVFVGYKLGRKQTNPTIQPTPTSGVIITPAPDLTANWKTYTNNEYKFSFLYPLGITIKEGYDLDISSWHLDTPVYQVILTKNGQNYFIIEASKRYLPGDPSYIGMMSRGQKTIGNISWGEYFRPNDYGEGPPIPPVYGLRKENKSILYGIRFSGQKETTEEQNQILSTFKFLDQNQASNVSADTFIQNYYNAYLDCLNKHFANAMSGNGSDRSPKQDCPYNANNALTSDLDSQLEIAKGYDPVLCAQDTPQAITFDKAIISAAGTTTVVVHTIWGSSSIQNINVELQEIDNQWKITSVNCNL